MSDLTPERRDKMRRAVTGCTVPMGSTMWPIGGSTFLALLDAADERDLLAAAAERVRKVAAERTEPPYAWESADGWADGYDQAMKDVRCALSGTDEKEES